MTEDQLINLINHILPDATPSLDPFHQIDPYTQTVVIYKTVSIVFSYDPRNTTLTIYVYVTKGGMLPRSTHNIADPNLNTNIQTAVEEIITQYEPAIYTPTNMGWIHSQRRKSKKTKKK